jgi:hypothetical protein
MEASKRTPALGAADWISLAAAPTFAIMALLTGIPGGGSPDMLCSATQRCIAADRNGLDVFADERFPFGAMAEADLPRGKHCPPVMAQDFVSLALAPFLRRCGVCFNATSRLGYSICGAPRGVRSSGLNHT